MALREIRNEVGTRLPQFLQGMLCGYDVYERALALLPTRDNHPLGLIDIRAQLAPAQRGFVADVIELVHGRSLSHEERVAVEAFWRSEP